MATVTFDNVTERSGDVPVVDGHDRDGEFMLPDGSVCRKTTSLRIYHSVESGASVCGRIDVHWT